MSGHAPCTLLEWDSRFFGLRIARVNAARLTPESAADVAAWCAAQTIDCLYLLADADDPQTVRLAEAGGYHQVDVRLTFALTGLQAHPIPVSPDMSLRSALPTDLPALQAIASASYTASRFYFDQRFPRERCDALYATWAARDLDAALRDPQTAAVLVATDDVGTPAGFITGQVGDGGGVIGLVGVAAAARGRGLGLAVVQAGLAWFAARGCDRVTVVTQARSVAAQRLYQRCGFLTESLALWYHKWWAGEQVAAQMHHS